MPCTWLAYTCVDSKKFSCICPAPGFHIHAWIARNSLAYSQHLVCICTDSEKFSCICSGRAGNNYALAAGLPFQHDWWKLRCTSTRSMSRLDLVLYKSHFGWMMMTMKMKMMVMMMMAAFGVIQDLFWSPAVQVCCPRGVPISSLSILNYFTLHSI